jgi:hypothetical protein
MDFFILGIFYTNSKAVYVGKAYLINNMWSIELRDGSFLSFYTIYLDSSKKIEAPKNDFEKEKFREKVFSFINKYEIEVESYDNSGDFKSVSPSYSMGYKLAKMYLFEYKQIYINHFRSNSVKFMFDDLDSDWNND